MVLGFGILFYDQGQRRRKEILQADLLQGSYERGADKINELKVKNLLKKINLVPCIGCHQTKVVEMNR